MGDPQIRTSQGLPKPPKGSPRLGLLGQGFRRALISRAVYDVEAYTYVYIYMYICVYLF